MRATEGTWKVQAALVLAVLAVLAGAAWMRSRGGAAPEAARADPAQKRADALRRVDPALVLYREAGRYGVGLRDPRALALAPDGGWLVAGDQAIQPMRPDGKLGNTLRLDAAPHCLAAVADGTLYVGMRDHVEVYTAGGARKARWQRPGPRSYLTSLALAGESLWVADAGERVILRCDRSGKVLARLGKRDEARRIPGLVVPSPHLDVAVAGDGWVWVSNPGRHRVEAYAADGVLLRGWGGPFPGIEGFCGCCNPTDFALVPGGGFVTSEKGIPRVKRYGADGRFEGVVAAPDALAESVVGLDLAVDAEGRVLVLDPAARAVRVFARK